MTSTEQAQRSAAVDRLLEAAVEAFADKGFHATTTRDIAARVGLSPAGVYVHFASKEELLYELSLVGHHAALDIWTAAELDRANRGLAQARALRNWLDAVRDRVAHEVREHAPEDVGQRRRHRRLAALDLEAYPLVLLLRPRRGLLEQVRHALSERP